MVSTRSMLKPERFAPRADFDGGLGDAGEPSPDDALAIETRLVGEGLALFDENRIIGVPRL